ncbi:hypothetical protein AVEN_116990-1 [Araneus ventricosus]|uniref:Uncharacterized protein n=1 Tax=Araneus ventricosus TaxID=182803 RepID=A0A4Y1ZVF3_ARAVE|nr:hypothetical protein AVEN_116990-1 [Araneus ventricosus]
MSEICGLSSQYHNRALIQICNNPTYSPASTTSTTKRNPARMGVFPEHRLLRPTKMFQKTPVPSRTIEHRPWKGSVQKVFPQLPKSKEIKIINNNNVRKELCNFESLSCGHDT